MIQQYKWLLIALLMALLGIIYLQTNYTLNNFRLKTEEFEIEIDQLFKEAVTAEQNQRKEQVLSWFRAALSDTNRIEITASYDSLEKKTRYNIKDVGEDSPYTTISFQSDQRQLSELDEKNYQMTIDKIVNATKNYLDQGTIYYWTDKLGIDLISETNSTQVDTSQLALLFEEKLSGNKIFTQFQIKSTPYDSVPPAPASGVLRTSILNSDLNTEFTDIYAEIKNPYLSVLKRAWLNILGSVLIILLTATCFYIMLKIIYRQKQLSEIKDDFIDNMTHELQTPIATLMAANEGMQKYNLLEDKAKTEQYLAISKEQIHRLAKMVDQALHNSIYDRKRLIIELKHCELRTILEAAIQAIQTKYEKAQIKLQIQQGIDSVRIDPHHFKNVIGNLLDNALKHNPDQNDLIIEVDARIKPDNTLLLSIKDNGKGIPKSHAKKIFDKFYRVNDKEANGFGIGLFYVSQIIQKMGGTIQLENYAPQGCNFLIEIPQVTNEAT